MGERRKWKNVNTEESRKNYGRLRNGLKRATDNAKKEYLENICNEIMEFRRTGRYELMGVKTKELGGRRPTGFKILASKNWGGRRPTGFKILASKNWVEGDPWDSKYWHRRTGVEGDPRDSKYWHRRLQGNRIVDQNQVPKIWENYRTIRAT